jgi:hypothetical protein
MKQPLLSNVKLDKCEGRLHTELQMTASLSARTMQPALGLMLVLVITVILILPL